MERFENKYGNVWYIFKKEFTASFDEEYLYVQNIHSDFRSNKIDPDAPYRIGHSIYIWLLPAILIRHYVVYKNLPVSIVLEGSRVGYSVSNSGYGAADLGPGVRPIKRVECTINLLKDELRISFRISFGPIDKESLHRERSDAERSELVSSYELGIPFDDVPEVLNMNEKERKLLLRHRALKDVSNS